MGILNVTPDSFSDGGKFFQLENAVAQAWKMKEDGANVLDIGAESTRPDAPRVSEEEELHRLMPVLQELHHQQFPTPISLDTSKPNVARTALSLGYVDLINDVEGFRNPAMVDVVREFDCHAIMMHMFGTPDTMQREYHYRDVVGDLIEFFKERIERTGLKQKLILDPGLGFGKSVEHNLSLLNRLPEFFQLGLPLLVGASRKSFIGKVLDADVGDRLEGSLVCAALAAYKGAAIVRVHDVKETKRSLRMVEAIKYEKI